MGTLKGARAEVQTELLRFASLGIGRFVVMAATMTPDDYPDRLKQYASIWI